MHQLPYPKFLACMAAGGIVCALLVVRVYAHNCPLLSETRPFAVRAVKKYEWTADVFFKRWSPQTYISFQWHEPTTLLMANHADVMSQDGGYTSTVRTQSSGPYDAARLMLHVKGASAQTPFITCALPDNPEQRASVVPPSVDLPSHDVQPQLAQAVAPPPARPPPSPARPPSPPPSPTPPPNIPSPTPSAPPGLRVGEPYASTHEILPMNASMETELAQAGRVFSARNCIDGITNNTDKSTLCVSEKSFNPWISVEIPEGSLIGMVAVYNRADCCEDELSPFVIWASNSPGIPEDLNLCGDEMSVPSSVEIFSVQCSGIEGRYVTLMLPGSDRSLGIAELRIFGLESPPPGLPPLAPSPRPSSPHPLPPPPSRPPQTPPPCPELPPAPNPYTPPPSAPPLPGLPPGAPPPPYTKPSPIFHLFVKAGEASRVSVVHNQPTNIILEWNQTQNESRTAEKGDWATFVPVVVGSCAGATWLGAAFGGALDDQLAVSVRLPSTTPSAARQPSEDDDPNEHEEVDQTSGLYALCLAKGPFSALSSGPTRDSAFEFYSTITVHVGYAPPSPRQPPPSPASPCPPDLPTAPEFPPPIVPPAPATTTQKLDVMAAYLSSVAPIYDGQDFEASKCIDEDTSATSFCMSSPYANDPWLSVQLRARSVVSEIVIYGRQDCCQEFLPPFEIWVSEKGGMPSLDAGDTRCGGPIVVPLTAGPFHVLCQDGEHAGNFVTLLLSGAQRTLTITELQIFGSIGALPQSHTSAAVVTEPTYGQAEYSAGLPSLFSDVAEDLHLLRPWMIFAIAGFFTFCGAVGLYVGNSKLRKSTKRALFRNSKPRSSSKRETYSHLNKSIPEPASLQDEEGAPSPTSDASL